MVHSAAVRQDRDPHLAEEIVFVRRGATSDTELENEVRGLQASLLASPVSAAQELTSEQALEQLRHQAAEVHSLRTKVASLRRLNRESMAAGPSQIDPTEAQTPGKSLSNAPN